MTAERAGADAAGRFRGLHGLGAAPIGDIVTLVERTCRVDVVIVDAPEHEHGLTVRDPARDVVMIGIARSTKPLRQRSTVAHELGHLILGDHEKASSVGWAARSPEEQRADAFARHLLVPLGGVDTAVPAGAKVTEHHLSELVRWFQASPQIVAIQLRGIGRISPATAEAWGRMTGPALADRFGWRSLYEALQRESNTTRPPQRLLARVTEAYAAGIVGPEVVARVQNISAAAASAYLTQAGIATSGPPPEWGALDPAGGSNDDFSDLDDPALDGTVSPRTSEP